MQALKIFVSALILFFQTANAAATRTVTDAEGTQISVPDRPMKVVALSEIDFDISLALGASSVGTVNGRGQNGHPHYLETSEYAATIKTIPIVGDIGRPNMEAIIKLQPDLILTAPSRPEVVMVLRKIAPTFVSHKNGEPWKDVFNRVAVSLNREAEAKTFMAKYEQELTDAKAKLGNKVGQTVSIVRWNPNGPAFMYQDSFASLVLRDLGFTRPEPQKIPGQKHSMPVSFEALNIIDADWLFIGTLDPKGDAASAMQEMHNNAAFKRLNAVKANQYYTVDGSMWTSIGGPIAALDIVRKARDVMSK